MYNLLYCNQYIPTIIHNIQCILDIQDHYTMYAICVYDFNKCLPKWMLKLAQFTCDNNLKIISNLFIKLLLILSHRWW